VKAGATTEIRVALQERSYSIHVGSDLLAEAGELVAALGRLGSILLVTNPTVRALYGDVVVTALAAAGRAAPAVVEIPDGEQYKTVATLERIYDAALDAGVDRSSVVVALGGGVVGDVAGFAAATLLRGVRLVMVPTTLLAQVDSSVGGKTGVNRPQGKNLVGAFHQPSLVVADTKTLATLSDREYGAGLAEVVKYGVTLDEALFELLERRSGEILARDPELLAEIVARSARLKADVVERDEREGGLRRILNFGHTVGHALEQVTGYTRYLHGEAVAIGMVAAAELSQRIGTCGEDVVPRLVRLLDRLGLQASLPGDVDLDAVARAVALDKKVERGRVAFIVLDGVGRCAERTLTLAEVGAALAGMIGTEATAT
jgi:3-dehydroquinate synthase